MEIKLVEGYVSLLVLRLLAAQLEEHGEAGVFAVVADARRDFEQELAKEEAAAR